MSTETIRPNAAGDETNLGPIPAVANYLNVDEVVADNLTTYLYNYSGAYKRDLYNLGDTVGDGTINHITVYVVCAKSVNSAKAKTAIKTGGTVFEGNEETITVEYTEPTWQIISTQYDTNPDTGNPWTWDELDALQAGVNANDDTADTIYVTQVYVVIDYTEVSSTTIESTTEESTSVESTAEESSFVPESSALAESSYEPSGVIDVSVAGQTDDVYVYDAPGWTLLNNDSLQIGMFGSLKQGMGLRFNNITIPKGAVIHDAYITFKSSDLKDGDTVTAVIIGQKDTNPETFSDIANYQERRGTVVGGANDDHITDASVSWSPVEHWASGSLYQTPDISTVIQEIVDQGGWKKGNSLVLFVDDHAGNSTVGAYRIANSFDTGVAPTLHIEWDFVEESSGYGESSTSVPGESTAEESTTEEESSFAESSLESSGGPEEKVKFIFGEADLVYEIKKFLGADANLAYENKRFVFGEATLNYQNVKYMSVVIRLVNRLTKPTAGSIFSRTSAVTKEVT